jgi:hypothetical protein
VVTQTHIGVTGTINAEQLSAASGKTRDTLVRQHSMGKNPAASQYGYEKRLEHDPAGERIKGLQKIVPARTAIIVRICEEFVAGLGHGRIVQPLTEEEVPPPRRVKGDKQNAKKLPAWTPNIITGGAIRGTGILNDIFYTGRRGNLS